MQQKITKIIAFEPDIKTKAVAKEIQTTSGNFYSRCCAYNQTLIQREEIMHLNARQSLDGPNIYIHSMKFRLDNRSNYENIKDITRSRKNEKTLYKVQVGIFKKILGKNQNKVCFFNFPFFKNECNMLNKEDIISLIDLQVEADAAYITVPFIPDFELKINLEILAYANSKIKENSSIKELVPCLSTRLPTNDFLEILSTAIIKTEINCVFISCKALSTEKTSALLSYMDDNFPKSKLLIGVDIEDSSRSPSNRLSNHLFLRSFSFDITCREVYFPLVENEPILLERKRLYHEKSGAMFNEKEQEDWEGISFTDYIIKNFPADCNLSVEEFIICLNFVKLNKTGLEEVNAILEKRHDTYIQEKPYYLALWASRKSFLEDSE